MNRGVLIGVIIAGICSFLGSMGTLISSLEGWEKLTTPAMVGAILIQLSSIATMVLAALGIDLPRTVWTPSERAARNGGNPT